MQQTTETTVTQTPNEKDIEQVKAAIAKLEDAVGDLFQLEITNLKEKLTKLETQGKADIE